MHTNRTDEIRKLPIDHVFQTSNQGGVYSRQCLVLPHEWLPHEFVTTAEYVHTLGPFYFDRLTRLTRGLIRVRKQREEVRFELAIIGWPLLCFGPATFDLTPVGGDACYPLQGGLMLEPGGSGRGYLCVGIHTVEAGIRICMEVKEYRPRISGSGASALRRWLYENTQARLHHWIAYDFVRQVGMALCEGKLVSVGR